MKKELKYTMYSRVSTEKQRNAKGLSKDQIAALQVENTGLGLASQRDACKAFIQANDGVLVGEFEEVVSGANKETISFGSSITIQQLLRKRPLLMAAIRHAKETNSILLVKDFSRLTRFRLLGEYLMATGVKFQCADSPNDNNFIISLKINLAQEEAEAISKRTSAALRQKVLRTGEFRKKNPDYVSGKVAEQARKIHTENSLANENNVKAASMISMLFAAKKTYREIVDILNKNKFYTANGCQFQVAQVQRLKKKFLSDT